jgi:multicomponent Na+:H+ antiporter subunit G
MNTLLDLLSWISLIAGSVFIIIGTIGLIRFPDFFTRLHAASIVDTLGCIFIMFGLMLQAGLSIVTVKLFLVVVFILLTTPAAAHALAKAALHGEVKPLLHHSGDET